MHVLLTKVDEQLARFVDMRNREFDDVRTNGHEDSWKQRTQYLQGRVECLESVKKMILERLSNPEPGTQNSERRQ